MKAGDSTRRALRTLVQVSFVGVIITLLSSFEVINWTAQQTAAVMAFATPVVVFIQNLLEDNTSVPALLKAPASSGENPTPKDPPPPLA